MFLFFRQDKVFELFLLFQDAKHQEFMDRAADRIKTEVGAGDY